MAAIPVKAPACYQGQRGQVAAVWMAGDGSGLNPEMAD
jgi:hypothetical protein